MRLTPALFIALSATAFGCTTSSNNAGPDGGAPPVDAAPADGAVVPSACPAPTGGPTTHKSSVAADETWTAAASPHILPYDTEITATLTLEPCAVVLLAPRLTVTISTKGSIVGTATATTPISIAARDAGKPWAVIRAIGGTMNLTYATIDGGGDPLNTSPVLAGALYGQTGGDPASAPDAFALKHVVVSGSKSNGVTLTGTAHFSADSTALTVTGSAGYPVSIFPRVVGSLPSGTYTGNANDEILLPGGGQGEVIIDDQTMHERGVPYHVGHPSSAGELRVGSSSAGAAVATLTIEPGVVVRFQKKGYFEVEEFGGANPATGALVAKGTVDKPIRFTSAEAAPAPGDWVGVNFGGLVDPKTALDYVWVEYAGLQTSGGSGSCMTGLRQHAVSINGTPTPRAFITNSKVTHAPNAINSGWKGAPVDFTVSNTFEDISGCKLTNPPDANNDCTGRPPCAVN